MTKGGPSAVINILASDDRLVSENWERCLEDDRWINAATFRDQCEILLEYLHFG